MTLLRSCTLPRLIIAAVLGLCAHATNAADRRLDVATYNNSGNDTDWFGDSQVPYLSFTSPNGHDIEQGSNAHISKLTSAGNSLGMYYDPFHTLYSPTETPAAAASTIESWCNSNFGSGNTNRWLVLNEVDASTWNGSSGDAYRTWLVNTVSTLNAAGYKNIVLYSPRYLGKQDLREHLAIDREQRVHRRRKLPRRPDCKERQLFAEQGAGVLPGVLRQLDKRIQRHGAGAVARVRWRAFQREPV